MSRETDSSSSGPKRRGGSSYPSGTEPYGTSGPDAGQGDRGAEPAAGSKPDEPKTETTLTTRIRINIPGSRPIPPVVMRTPVEDGAEGTSERADKSGSQNTKGAPDLGAGKRATTGGSGAAAVPPPPPASGASAAAPSASGSGQGSGGDDASGAEEKSAQRTSDWFAPRKPPKSTSAPSGPAPAGPGAGAGAGTGPGVAGGDRGDLPYYSGPGPETTGTHGVPETTGTHGMPETTGTYGYPETTGTHGMPDTTGTRGFPEATGTHGMPDSTGTHGMPDTTGTHGLPETTGTHGVPGAPGAGSPFPGGAGPMDTPPDGVPHLGPLQPGGPAGPTTGPATGDMPVPPARGSAAPGPLAAPGAGQDFGSGSDFDTGPVTGAQPPGAGQGHGPGQGDGPARDGSGLDALDRDPGAGPRAPGVGPSGTPPSGTPMIPGAGAPGGMEPPGAPGAAGPGPGGPQTAPGGEARLSSDTMISGVPQTGGTGEPGGPTAPPPGPSSPPPGTGSTGAQSAQSGARSAKPAKKGGRSKLVLAGVAVVGVLGVAYGTGLLLDHADVPKGTTVLGVEIGGLSKHEAVNKLDDELGDRSKEPFRIETSGGPTELKPSVAGVTLDTEATVRSAAGRDYNPVSVIGSLMGGTREADPAVQVDEAKVRAALEPVLAKAEAKSPAEGMVKFTGGKAVAVKGSPHKVIDVDKAPAALEKAFKQRAVSGKNEPVELPGKVSKPKVTAAQLDKAVNGFGRTAMSGWVWLKAGDVKVPFSQKTIGKFLTMRAVGSGTLQPVIDTAKLKATYGSAFDNVVIEGGAGKVKMTPKHAASAMVQALRKKAPPEPAQRVAEVPGAGSR
ncbi:peptidoglycan binding domain-containing protein [Streptomyces sp. CA-250714]|uniref:peptidoglycan binding domain-containing protein n=1 Tax=Streptomyces sp. CA-250714 TaxID=3240060 RepID=UPI003D9081A1